MKNKIPICYICNEPWWEVKTPQSEYQILKMGDQQYHRKCFREKYPKIKKNKLQPMDVKFYE